jgi:hypothetical protein
MPVTMINDRTKSYFDDIVMRASYAGVVPREPWSEGSPNCCHANVEAFVCTSAEYQIVRGWLVANGHWLVPHSVVRHTLSGKLVDITPDPSGSVLPFVEHRGTEADFAVLRQGRDGGWLHPPLATIPE